jgi:hypothetical protein
MKDVKNLRSFHPIPHGQPFEPSCSFLLTHSYLLDMIDEKFLLRRVCPN